MPPGVDSVSSWNPNMQQLLQNWKVIQFWQRLTWTDQRMPSLGSSTTLQDFPQCCTLSKFHAHRLYILELFFVSKSLLSSALKMEVAGFSEIFVPSSQTLHGITVHKIFIVTWTPNLTYVICHTVIPRWEKGTELKNKYDLLDYIYLKDENEMSEVSNLSSLSYSECL